MDSDYDDNVGSSAFSYSSRLDKVTSLHVLGNVGIRPKDCFSHRSTDYALKRRMLLVNTLHIKSFHKQEYLNTEY